MTETSEVYGSLYSEAVQTKAARFEVEGKVSRFENAAWRVTGDHGSYVVRANKDWRDKGFVWMTCSCPLRDHVESLLSYCSHALAVRLVEGR